MPTPPANITTVPYDVNDSWPPYGPSIAPHVVIEPVREAAAFSYSLRVMPVRARIIRDTVEESASRLRTIFGSCALLGAFSAIVSAPVDILDIMPDRFSRTELKAALFSVSYAGGGAKASLARFSAHAMEKGWLDHNAMVGR